MVTSVGFNRKRGVIMRKVKLTKVMVAALRGVTYLEDGRMILPANIGVSTAVALINRGICLPLSPRNDDGVHALTVQGVSAWATASEEDSWNGCTVSVDDEPEHMAEFVPSLSGVTVEGDADVPAVITTADGPVEGEFDYDAYRAGLKLDPEVLAMYTAYDAHKIITEASKLTASKDAHAMRLSESEALEEAYSHTDDITDHESVSSSLALVRAIQGGAIPVTGVIQGLPGISGLTRYHNPACADVKREMSRWGQEIGDDHDDAIHIVVSSVMDILAFEFGDIASSTATEGTPEWWEEIVYEANGEEWSGVRIMPCLSLPMGMAGVRELAVRNGRFELVNVLESARCVRCNVHGDVSMPGKTIEAEGHVCGFCLAVEKDDSQTYAPMILCVPCGTSIHDTAESRKGHEDYWHSEKIPAIYSTGETLVTKEYLLEIIVDDITGATVDLGWHTFTVTLDQVHDYSMIAELYGALNGSGKPRHGWGSLIRVIDVDDV